MNATAGISGVQHVDAAAAQGYRRKMRITSGKVVAGKVVVDDEALPEGATVTVVSPEESEEFELGPADEAALREAIHAVNTQKLTLLVLTHLPPHPRLNATDRGTGLATFTFE